MSGPAHAARPWLSAGSVLALAGTLSCSQHCTCGAQTGPQIGQSGERDGLMVGYTTATSAILWARPRDPDPLRVRYGTAQDLSDSRLSDPQTPQAARDYTVHFELSGLQPATRYHYFVESVARPGQGALVGADIGSFMTAPQDRTDFAVAFGSCLCPGFPQTIWDSIHAAGPSLFLMIGDHHYGDTTDLAQLRAAYRSSRAIEGFARLAMTTPVLGQWDDHDYAGDDADGTHPGKATALRVFKEYWANPIREPDDPPGTWFQAEWGGVDFFVLDLRYWRNVQGASMLGNAQRQWLLSGLRSSAADFKFIVSPSVMNDGGTADSWAVYHTAEREEILDTIQSEGIGGVVVLSGDRHRTEVWKLREGTAQSYPIYEFVSSSLANSASDCEDLSHPGRLFCGTDDNFFGWLQFQMDRRIPSLTYEARTARGAVIYRLELTASELSPPRNRWQGKTGLP